MDRTRRNFLACAALIPAALVGGRLASAMEAVCYDPSSLPLSIRNRRKALGFVEQSADARRRCGLCAFYHPAQGNCGSCQLLSGGAVTAAGSCNSFAAKPA